MALSSIMACLKFLFLLVVLAIGPQVPLLLSANNLFTIGTPVISSFPPGQTCPQGDGGCPASPPQTLKGVNLAGAEFNEEALPGVEGIDYFYPTRAEVDYFIDKGLTTFRLPFLWERLQPRQNGPFDDAELARIDDFVAYATDQGAYVILDVHNYGAYRLELIGTTGVPTSSFVDLWTRLANRYKGNDHVIFGLMNEPGHLRTIEWRTIAQEALTGIRDTGAKNLVLNSVIGASDLLDWQDLDYKTVAEVYSTPLNDPANNNALELHQYFDPTTSGTEPTCTRDLSYFEPVTAWARQHGWRLFLGEFGVADNPACLSSLDDALSHLGANEDVWIGWTYWAAGPAWGDYMFSVEPTESGMDRPQMKILRKHL